MKFYYRRNIKNLLIKKFHFIKYLVIPLFSFSQKLRLILSLLNQSRGTFYHHLMNDLFIVYFNILFIFLLWFIYIIIY